MLPAAISGDALLRSEGTRDDLLQRAISRDCQTPRLSLECALISRVRRLLQWVSRDAVFCRCALETSVMCTYA
jgi:hypothetical protein